MKIYFIIFLIISIGIIIYSNSLGNDFVWDDHFLVVNNDFIKNAHFIPSHFISRNALASEDFGQIYRPLVMLSYTADYFFWKLNPMGYHFANVISHIINAIAVFYLVLLLTKNRFVGLLSALIFLTHPVGTEAVAWISGRKDVLFLFFFLTALIAYIRYARRKQLIFYASSLIFFLFALFSKEMAASLPFILILYDWLYGRDEKVRLKPARVVPYFLILGIYVAMRFLALGKFAEGAYYTGYFYTTFLTMLKGIAHYVKLLFYPVGLCAEYFTFPIATSVRDHTVLLSMALILGLMALGFILAKRSKHVTFAIFWFFITLGPVMNIIPINVLIAERFLYLPSIGFAMAIAVLFKFLFEKFKKKAFLKYAILFVQVIVILLYSYLTMSRNTTWANDEVLSKKILEKYPDNYRIRYNLAVTYMRKDNSLEKAYREIQKTIKIAPDFLPAKMLLYKYYYRTNQREKARDLLTRIKNEQNH